MHRRSQGHDARAAKSARLAGEPIALDDLLADLDGVVIRINGSTPHLPQRLSDALNSAAIAHQIKPLIGACAGLAPADYFDLAIGRAN